MSWGRTVLVALCFLGATGAVLAGDRAVTIELRSGESLDGTLVSMKDHIFTVKVGAEVRTLSEDEIKRIVFADAVEDPAKPKKPAGADLIDVLADESPLADVVADIGSRTGQPIFIDPAINEKVTINLRKIGWRDAVEVLAKMCRCEAGPFGEGSFLVRQEPLVTQAFRNAEIRKVLDVIGSAAGRNVVVASDLTERISVDFKETPWLDALETVVKAGKLHAARSGNTVLVTRDRVTWGDADLRAGDASVWPGKERSELVPGTKASKTVDLSVRGLDLRDVHDQVGRAVGKNIIVEPEIHVTVTLSVKNAPWHDVVTFLARAHRHGVECRGSIVVITAPPPIAIRIRGAAAADAFPLLGRYAGVNVVVGPGVTGELGRVDLASIDYRAAIRIIAEINGLTVDERSPDTITIGADEKLRPRILKSLPRFEPLELAFPGGVERTVDLRAIVIDPRPESKNAVLVGPTTLGEQDDVKDPKGKAILRVVKIESGRVRFHDRASDGEATAELP